MSKGCREVRGESDGSLGKSIQPRNSQSTGLELEEAGLVGDEAGDQEEAGVAGGEGGERGADELREEMGARW